MPEFLPDPSAEALRSEFGYDIIAPSALTMLLSAAPERPRKRVLEIGTAVGYSALCLAAVTGAEVDTVERDPARLDIARKLWSGRPEESRIHAYSGAAEEVLPRLAEKYVYDFVFIDAAKSAYSRYLDLIYDAIDTGGIIFADDVNYLGLVEGGAYPPHKHRTIVNNMRAFVAKISDPALFDSKIYDVGDGVAVCRKL